MGAWKKLNQQDVAVTSYTAKKSWTVNSGSLDSNGIQIHQALTSSHPIYYLTSSDKYEGTGAGATQHPILVYKSLSHLYFKNHNSSSGLLQDSSSYVDYNESTIATGSRAISNRALVYSIPRNRFGTHIEPGSFSLGESAIYASEGFVSGGYIADTENLVDDGEGSLRILSTSGSYAGAIIYSHGLAIITDPTQESFYRGTPLQNMSWKSNVPIYTYNYTVKLNDNEFNFTQNPSALTGSDNSLKNELTGSYFQPYITAVGLYNDSNELIAVGKLAKPLPKSKNTETTIQIKIDI